MTFIRIATHANKFRQIEQLCLKIKFYWNPKQMY